MPVLSMVKDANTNPLYEQYSDLRTYLRTTKLDTSSVKADIADYNEWRKSHMGSMKLGNDGMQIDTGDWKKLFRDGKRKHLLSHPQWKR